MHSVRWIVWNLAFGQRKGERGGGESFIFKELNFAAEL